MATITEPWLPPLLSDALLRFSLFMFPTTFFFKIAVYTWCMRCLEVTNTPLNQTELYDLKEFFIVRFN